MTQKTTPAHGTVASPDDIRRIIANLDDEKLLDIMALQPTVLDIEEASLWLAGDSDIFWRWEATWLDSWGDCRHLDRRSRGRVWPVS